jgi:hypothetical protein
VLPDGPDKPNAVDEEQTAFEKKHDASIHVQCS